MMPRKQKITNEKKNQNIRKQPSKPNPSLKHLEVFVGEWDMEISNASFLPDPQTKVHGPASFKWVENGAFLVMYQGSKGTQQATWLIGRDESAETYKMLYFDSRGVSRVYEMSFNDGIWKIWRDSPGFSQCFEGKFSDDGNTITACWEKSSNGIKWEHDFDLKYIRVL